MLLRVRILGILKCFLSGNVKTIYAKLINTFKLQELTGHNNFVHSFITESKDTPES